MVTQKGHTGANKGGHHGGPVPVWFARRRPGIDVASILSAVLPVTPMLATPLAEPFHRPGWVYQEKYDGWPIDTGFTGQPERVWMASSCGARIEREA